eukprot:gene10024-13480_t
MTLTLIITIIGFLVSNLFLVCAFQSPIANHILFQLSSRRFDSSIINTKRIEIKSSKIDDIDTIAVSSLPTSSQLIDKTIPEPSNMNDIVKRTERFISLFQQILNKETNFNSENFSYLINENCKWENPIVSNLNELKEGVNQFFGFFESPSLTVYDTVKISSNQVKISYQLSFWYPLPWRPRIIIPSSAIITYDSKNEKIVNISEIWELSLTDIFFKLWPRWWDAWHVFSTPSPEYPPVKQIGSLGAVSFVELPQTVALEVRWSGAAKFPGPPLSVVPGFALFGSLKTSKPNRDKFFTVLPVEVQSSRYTQPNTDEEMKRTSWVFHVPSHLHNTVFDKAKQQIKTKLANVNDEFTGEDDLVDEIDYLVGLENMSTMKEVKAGAVRGGDFELNTELMAEFEAKESKEYIYRILPKRIVVQIDVKGELDTKKISEALTSIKAAVKSNGPSILRKKNVQIKSKYYDSDLPDIELSPLVGLQLHYCKGCFNSKAEPAMAIYEMQYNVQLAKVFLELEVD